MKQKETKEIALNVSEELLATATNVILFTLFLIYGATKKMRTYYPGSVMYDTAIANLQEFNYSTIKNAIIQLKHKKLISYPGRITKTTLIITKQGEKRLQELLPTYKTKRVWDQKIYLISYDIPEKNAKDRKMLRQYIETLGGAMLQKSFYLIPYDPSIILKEFTQEKNLHGTILVSCIGENGFIGGEQLKNLINRVYQLDFLKKRYQHFIEKYKLKKPANLTKFAFEFLAIVKDDPQLPFELLGKDWLGNKAYKLYKQFIS